MDMEQPLVEMDVDQPLLDVETNLLDVNGDCLQQIFGHLDLEDLLNINQTCKQLKPATESVFKRKFGKKTFRMYAFYVHYVEVGSYDVRVQSIKLSLQLLRCFGRNISKLVAWGREWFFLSYVNEFCHDSLEDITFHNVLKPQHSNEECFMVFKKPFANAQTVRFITCDLDGQLRNLNEWFPQMRALEISACQAGPECIEAIHPHLEQLQIIGLHTIDRKNVVSLFRLNPQLQSLILDVNFMRTILRAANEHLPMLEYLKIDRVENFFTDFGNDVLHFGNLKRLSIFYSGKLSAKIPISMNFLEEFEWRAEKIELNHVFFDFFEKNSSILQMGLFGHSKLSDDDIKTIFEALPLLGEIHFGSN